MELYEVNKIPVAQGEVIIKKIDNLPDDMETRPVDHSGKGWIISHSEQGNHHLLLDGEVMERTDNIPAGMKKIYAILNEPSFFIQDAATPHEGFSLPAGIYEFRISREYNPFKEEARRVAD